MRSKLGVAVCLLALAAPSPLLVAEDQAPVPAPAAAAAAAPESAAPATSAPAPLAEGQLLLLEIPDLRQTLDRIERAANVIHPNSMASGSLATDLGTAFGDPTLAALGKGPVLLATLKGGVLPVPVLIVPSTQPAALMEFVKGRGMAADTLGGLLVISQTADGLAAGKTLAASYPALTAAPFAGDLRLIVAVKPLVDALAPMATMFLGGIAEQAANNPAAASKINPADLKKLLTLEIAALQAYGDQLQTSQIDVGITGDTIAIDHWVVAMPHGPLAEALVAPSAAALARRQAAAARLGAGNDLLRVIGALDIGRLAGAFTTVMSGVLSDPQYQDFLDQKLLAAMTSCSRHLTGTLGMVARCQADGTVATAQAWSCDDAVTCRIDSLALLDDLGKSPMLPKLMGGIGKVSYTTTPDFATIPGPTPGSVLSVDRFDTQMTPLTAPASPGAAPAPGVPTSPAPPAFLTFSDGWSLSSQSLASLEGLFAQGRPPLVVQAQATFGPGQDGYGDCDLPGMVLYQMAVLKRAMVAGQQPGAAAAPPVIKPSPLLQFCWRVQDGAATSRALVPLASLAAVGEAVQAAVGAALHNPAPAANGGGKEF